MLPLQLLLGVSSVNGATVWDTAASAIDNEFAPATMAFPDFPDVPDRHQRKKNVNLPTDAKAHVQKEQEPEAI